jgi:hypothetical protein
MTAGDAAADAIRAPFALGDRGSLWTLFDDAGAQGTKVETYTGTARFPSVREMVEADLRGWLPVVGVVLSGDLIREILDEHRRILHINLKDFAFFAREIAPHDFDRITRTDAYTPLSVLLTEIIRESCMQLFVALMQRGILRSVPLFSWLSCHTIMSRDSHDHCRRTRNTPEPLCNLASNRALQLRPTRIARIVDQYRRIIFEFHPRPVGPSDRLSLSDNDSLNDLPSHLRGAFRNGHSDLVTEPSLRMAIHCAVIPGHTDHLQFTRASIIRARDPRAFRQAAGHVGRNSFHQASPPRSVTSTTTCDFVFESGRVSAIRTVSPTARSRHGGECAGTRDRRFI